MNWKHKLQPLPDQKSEDQQRHPQGIMNETFRGNPYPIVCWDISVCTKVVDQPSDWQIDWPTLPSLEERHYHGKKNIQSPVSSVVQQIFLTILQRKCNCLESGRLARTAGKQTLWGMGDVLEVPAGGREGNSSLLPCRLRHLFWARLIGSRQVKVHTLCDRERVRESRPEQEKSYLGTVTRSLSIFHSI